jgi:hypothetical protein
MSALETPNQTLHFVKQEAESNKFQNVYRAETGQENLYWFAVEYTGEAETTSLILAHQHEGRGTHIIYRETHHNLTEALDQASAAQASFSDNFDRLVG